MGFSWCPLSSVSIWKEQKLLSWLALYKSNWEKWMGQINETVLPDDYQYLI
jgi:hypothetical protein